MTISEPLINQILLIVNQNRQPRFSVRNPQWERFEVLCYLAIIIRKWLGLNGDIEDYGYDTNDGRKIKNSPYVISYNRLKGIHAGANPSTEQLLQLCSAFEEGWVMGCEDGNFVTIDETIVPYKGPDIFKAGLFKAIKGKPHKFVFI